MDRTKISKGKKIVGWYDTGAPPPSLAEAKGSAHTRYWYVHFGDEEDGGGGDVVEGLPFFLSLRLRMKFSSISSQISCSSSNTLLHRSCVIVGIFLKLLCSPTPGDSLLLLWWWASAMETRGQDLFYITTITFLTTKGELSIGYGHSPWLAPSLGEVPRYRITSTISCLYLS